MSVEPSRAKEVDEPGDRPFENLLVVAGVRGAGKTELTAQFLRGRLSPEIAGLLPSPSVGWAFSGEDKQMVDRIIARAGEQDATRHLIVHFDLLSMVDQRRERHLRAAAEAMDLARQVTVINMRIKPDRLRRQYYLRESSKLPRPRPRSQPLRWLRLLIREGRPTFEDSWRLGRDERHHLRVYSSQDGIEMVETAYSRWNALVRSVVGCEKVTIVDVEPMSQVGDANFRWRLLAAATV